MKRAVLAVFLGASLVGLSAASVRADDAKAKAAEKGREAFAGTWDLVSVRPAGVTKDARQLVFRTDGTYAALDKDGKELWAGTFDLDPTADPKAWDHRSHEAKKKGGDVLGVYELTGDTLQVSCVVGSWKEKEWVGKPRPKGVDGKGADVVIELRRAKPDKR